LELIEVAVALPM